MNWPFFRKRDATPSNAASALAKHGAAQRKADRDAMTQRLRMGILAGHVANLRPLEVIRAEVRADRAKRGLA